MRQLIQLHCYHPAYLISHLICEQRLGINLPHIPILSIQIIMYFSALTQAVVLVLTLAFARQGSSMFGPGYDITNLRAAIPNATQFEGAFARLDCMDYHILLLHLTPEDIFSVHSSTSDVLLTFT